MLNGSAKLYESKEMAPFISASFDIEADSSHGDFPLAIKDYKKLANDILEKYNKIQSNIKKSRLAGKHNKVTELTKLLDNRKIYLNKLLNLAFNPDNQKLAHIN